MAIGTAYSSLDLVFAEPSGEPIHPDGFSRSFREEIGKIDVPRIRLHDLRHTHATVAFTMDVYSHAIPALQHEAADVVASMIGNA